MTQQARAAFQYATLNVFQMSSRQQQNKVKHHRIFRSHQIQLLLLNYKQCNNKNHHQFIVLVVLYVQHLKLKNNNRNKKTTGDELREKYNSN